jgi:hypothetical protein
MNDREPLLVESSAERLEGTNRLLHVGQERTPVVGVRAKPLSVVSQPTFELEKKITEG